MTPDGHSPHRHADPGANGRSARTEPLSAPPDPLARLTIVIPTLDAAAHLTRGLASLRAADGALAAAVLIVDGGSRDATFDVATRLGARTSTAPRGRGNQLTAGGRAALADPDCDWLLFLHADTALSPGWQEVVTRFITDPANRSRAAVFRFALDDDSPQARRLTAMVDWRVRRLALPYGDQGLLIHRDLYADLGGHRPLPLMEDVDIIRRIGRSRLTVLDASAITSAERWRREGWWWRSSRNVACLALYYLGVPPRLIKKLYG